MDHGRRSPKRRSASCDAFELNDVWRTPRTSAPVKLERQLWVGTASSSPIEAVAGEARTASRVSYGRSTSYNGRLSQRLSPGPMTAWCQAA
jgi:hypothetical protein